ncbi:PEP-utilizing enzyme, TIM barrel domain [Corynebacterium mustelae]|uniref:PEP-utilizing enzyme, TIM barrel domain n=1 Tax=Corynebacterium mustelae TaxID=571915 RepID=A0A0G3H1N6_9CORY|nr:putative PEP-binding protein [Corynebacterium mustelae]AKK06640.1 PEP-utilizing enzyme, TIM barrel domain [Corynebacterium mustelae]
MTVSFAISLSGESFPSSIASQITEVSLIRSEYLFRAKGYYPTADSAQQVISPYLAAVTESFLGPVWYRTLDVDTAEANVLSGCEEIIIESDRLRGLRGIRRSMRFPDAFDAELRALAQFEHENLGVIVPFLSTIAEAAWAIKRIRRFLPSVPVACMVEIPSLIWHIDALAELGYSRIVVGLNDLGSLCFGTIRKVQTPSGLPEEFMTILRDIVQRCRNAQVECVAAGYMNNQIVDVCNAIGFDSIAIHYSDLTSLFGIPHEDLPDCHLLSQIKAKTRRAIREFNVANGTNQVLF